MALGYLQIIGANTEAEAEPKAIDVVIATDSDEVYKIIIMCNTC